VSIEFINLYKEVMPYTLLTPDRLWYLWLLPRLQLEEQIFGEFAELGVYKGGSAKMIYQSVHGDCPMSLFDTFEGIPQSQVTDRDYHTRNKVIEEEGARGLMQAGSFSCPEEEVAKLMKNDKDNVWIYKGAVPNDDVKHQVGHVAFSFVHIDMDLYEPTAWALDFFFERMSPGGVFVVDDYGHLNGVTEAVKEFVGEKELKAVQSAFMQCVIRKPLVTEKMKWDPSNILWQFGG
jgi:O-methyltransferase